MKEQIRKHSLLLTLSIIFSFVSSASILLCIFAERRDLPLFLFLIPMIFWLGLIGEQILFWSANSVLKKIIGTGKIRRLRARPGIIAPLQTRWGIIADFIFVISLIVFAIMAIVSPSSDAIQFIFLFLIVFSFRIHCIANGKNYKYKKYLTYGRD